MWQIWKNTLFWYMLWQCCIPVTEWLYWRMNVQLYTKWMWGWKEAPALWLWRTDMYWYFGYLLQSSIVTAMNISPTNITSSVMSVKKKLSMQRQEKRKVWIYSNFAKDKQKKKKNRKDTSKMSLMILFEIEMPLVTFCRLSCILLMILT